MQKKSPSESGFVHLRNIVAVLLCLFGVSLAMFSLAAQPSKRAAALRSARPVHGGIPIITPQATPATGTLTNGSGPVTWTGGPFVVSNATAQANGTPTCTGTGQDCDDFHLAVTVITDPTKQVRISVQWPNSTADFDVYVYDSTGTTVVATSATSSDPETCFVPATTASYIVRVVPFLPLGQSYTATASLETPPAAAVPSGSPAPRYQNYPAPASATGAGSSGEPSIGIDWNPNVASLKHDKVNLGGVAFFTANLNEYRVNFDDCPSPAINVWEDKTNSTEGVTTLDPIGFVDHLFSNNSPSTSPGRVFQSQLAGATSIMSYSDDDGNTWTQSQGSGQPAGVDHETVGGGPYAPTNTSVVPPVVEPPHPLYPNQIYYASQDVGTAFAARSDDGGATFGPGVAMWNITQCGGLHGHVKVGPDGTVYVGNKSCGSNQAVAVSRDNGLTWTVKPIPGTSGGDTDPAVGIGSDNTVYFGCQNGDGHPHIAVSTNHGDTWHDVDAGGNVIQHCVFPEVVAGDGDRAAFGFLGTTTGGNYQDTNNFKGVWYFWIATTFDRGQTYTLVNATGHDPVQIGSICTAGTTCGADRNMLDFNDITIDEQGRVLAAYADGCVAPNCTEETASSTNPPYNASRSALGSVLRQSGGPRLLHAFDPAEPAVPLAPRVDSVTQSSPGTTVSLSWSEPDNSGSSLTGYKVYRKDSGTNTYAVLATITLGCPSCKTSYDDNTATNANLTYTYKVTATNAIGEGTNCGEFPVGLSGPISSPCTVPGITELTDPSGDTTPPPPANVPGTDLLSFQLAQPYAPDGNIKLVFTINTDAGQSPQPPGSAWYVSMQIQHGVTTSYKAVHMAYKASVANPNPTTPTFESYTPSANTSGGVDGRFVTSGTEVAADPSSNYVAPFNKVIIVVKASDLGLSPGDTITGFVSGSAQATDPTAGFVPVSGVTLYDMMPNSLAYTGSYIVNPNAVCAPNRPPIAGLSATPLSGDPPLVVNFDASSSSDPDTGDHVASYTFNFGDGSASVTQATPTISHTYQSNGHFEARLTVTDTHGAASSNLANVEIEIELPLDRVVSEKTHGSAGTFDVILFDPSVYPNGNGDIECRAEGSGYTVIYSFGSEFTVTGQASSTPTINNGGTVASHGPGPAYNQYQIHFNTGVTNAQHHTITLNGVPVTNGDKSNAPATINNAVAELSLLVGDTSGNGLVNSTDISQTQAQSGQPVTGSNFRTDVNANGFINSTDVSIVQSKSGTGLPTSP
jgi:hypothetical protein